MSKIIIALGNPGKKYDHTRHNAGFLALDWLVRAWNLEHGTWSKKFESEILYTEFKDQNIILVKPQNFMNNSGKAVEAICNFYKINLPKDLLVIHDDTDLPLGKIKFTESSSSAGHNGIVSIIESLGTQNFHRIRIGVETRQTKTTLPTETFVLQNFSTDELQKLQKEIFFRVNLEIEKFIGN